MAISTLAYKLVMDHKQFTQGTVASRKELNLAKRLMVETKTPVQKLEDALGSLGGLFRKGAIDQNTYLIKSRELKKAFENEGKAAKDSDRKIKDHTNSINGMRDSIGTLIPGLTSFMNLLKSPAAAIAGTGAAIGVVVSAIKKFNAEMANQREGITKVAEVSQKLGIPVNSFLAIDKAARRSGISTETLGTSFQRMSRKVGDANRGVGEAVKIFDSLGVDFVKLGKLTPDQQFIKIQEAISGLPTHVEKLSAEAKIFDSEGVELIRISNLTTEGFKALKEELRQTGEALSEMDVKRILDTNDAVQQLEDTVTGRRRQAAVGTAPLYAEAATQAANISLLGRRANAFTGGRLTGTLVPQAIREGLRSTLGSAGVGAFEAFEAFSSFADKQQRRRIDGTDTSEKTERLLDKIEENTRSQLIVQEVNF